MVSAAGGGSAARARGGVAGSPGRRAGVGPAPLLTDTAGLGAALRAGLPGAAGAGRCGGDGMEPAMGTRWAREAVPDRPLPSPPSEGTRLPAPRARARLVRPHGEGGAARAAPARQVRREREGGRGSPESFRRRRRERRLGRRRRTRTTRRGPGAAELRGAAASAGPEPAGAARGEAPGRRRAAAEGSGAAAGTARAGGGRPPPAPRQRRSDPWRQPRPERGAGAAGAAPPLSAGGGEAAPARWAAPARPPRSARGPAAAAEPSGSMWSPTEEEKYGVGRCCRIPPPPLSPPPLPAGPRGCAVRVGGGRPFPSPGAGGGRGAAPQVEPGWGQRCPRGCGGCPALPPLPCPHRWMRSACASVRVISPSAAAATPETSGVRGPTLGSGSHK